MPYRWTQTTQDASAELTLWPHNSLPRPGINVFVLATFGLMTIPLAAMLGTVLLWGLLPFLLIALGGMWFALAKNRADRRIVETLQITAQDMHLVRQAPRQAPLEWRCNPYWVRVQCHQSGGPVPFYVTLQGGGREVEIGAFLSEEERCALFDELSDRIARLQAQPNGI